MTRVLLTYAGGSYGLGVSRSLKVASVPYHVIATDADRFSIQRAEGDERHRVPRASQQSFLPSIAELARSTRADFVWPGHDSDILRFAQDGDSLARPRFCRQSRTSSSAATSCCRTCAGESAVCRVRNHVGKQPGRTDRGVRPFRRRGVDQGRERRRRHGRGRDRQPAQSGGVA